MIGLTQEPFDINDKGWTEGGTDRVKFRDAIASKNIKECFSQLTSAESKNFIQSKNK